MRHLCPAMLGELDSVVGDELVNISILVAFGLCVPDQYYHLDV